MKVAPDLLGARLEAALGSGAVKTDPGILTAYAVDGKSPAFLCFPNDPEQISVALRTCAEAEASVVPRGGGTAIGLGNILHQLDVVLALERLNRLIEHDDANLTATVQAGMRVERLQQILRERNQFLAIDPPHPSKATVGGLVAANTNGPRRMLYGGVRDLVIGMKVALVNGAEIKAGGKVVKNVAGYDMCKLFVGSLGTLGIITEVTFKMAPVPERAATVLAWGSLSQGLEMAEDLLRSPLLPAAVALLNRDAASAMGLTSGMPAIAFWVEGFEDAVSRHLGDLKEMATSTGLAYEILRDEQHRHLWEHVRDFGASGDHVLYRVVVPLASVAGLVATLDQWSAAERPAKTVTHFGTGSVWVALDPDPAGVAWFPRLAALAQKHGGYTIMVAAPAPLKEGINVWGTPPPSLPIMQQIRCQFDPQGILNPGRFLPGL